MTVLPPPERRRELAGHTAMAQEIGTVGVDLEDDLVVGDGQGVEKPRPRCRRRLKLQNAVVVLSQTQLLRRAQHPVGLGAADLAPLELHAARQDGADRRERIDLSRLHVRRAADDFDRPARASGIDDADGQPVGVRVLFHLEHAGDEDVAQILVQRRDPLDRRDVGGEQPLHLARVERATQHCLQPTTREDHRTPPANCARKRTSLSYSNRMSGMP